MIEKLNLFSFGYFEDKVVQNYFKGQDELNSWAKDIIAQLNESVFSFFNAYIDCIKTIQICDFFFNIIILG